MTNRKTEGSEDKTRLPSISLGAQGNIRYVSLPSEPTKILPVLQVGPTISLDFPGNFIGLPFSYSKNLKRTCNSQ